MTANTHFDATKHLSHPKYRPDIDGLRAVAILSVVCFHAFPNLLKGGFIGVDIFFVISGFLISTIIFSNLESNSFSFAEFYSRRIKRIFPALFITLCACFAFGWFTLLADEYQQLGKQIAGGAGFVANFVFWKESGYFDAAAETKPLLHLWSLGIEEQFYIVWPLLLWFAWRQRLNLLSLTLMVLLISFGLNLKQISGNGVAAFYSPQTRFWELLIGSTLAYLTLYRQNALLAFRTRLDARLSSLIYAHPPEITAGTALRNVQSLFGATLIIIGVSVITKNDMFPGWWAILPTLGTMLIIGAGLGAWLNRTLLANRVMVWFGLISFPLYLWHWPLLSFARILEGDKPTQSIRVAAVLTAIVLAWLTYRFIEKPIRFGNHSQLKTVALFVLMLGIGSAGYYDYKHKGLSFRLKDDDRQAYSDYFDNSMPEQRYIMTHHIFEKFRAECSFVNLEAVNSGHFTTVPVKEISKECYTKDPKYDKTLFIWGDSNAQHLYWGLKTHLPKNWQILQVASFGCVPNINASQPSTTNFCKQSNWFALKTISETKPDMVIVAQHLEHNVETIKQITDKLTGLGAKKIIFPGPVPHWTSDLPKIILTKLWKNTPSRTYVGINQKVLEDNEALQKQFPNSDRVIFANLIETFCNQDGCLAYLGDDKKTGITSWDGGHLTPLASEYLAKNLLVDLIVNNSQ